jgi:hypothetical protein
MNKQLGVGFLPYEPLDKIKLKNDKKIYRIREIRMIQYIVNPKIEFEVLVSYAGNANWISSEQIEKRI